MSGANFPYHQGEKREKSSLEKNFFALLPRKPKQRNDDDESNQYFMSEPSLSEEGESSSGKVRARQVLLSSRPFKRSSSEDEGIGEDSNHQVRPQSPYPIQPPVPYPLRQQSPIPNSPGNTSLSSWDSPALSQQRKVYLHFATPEKKKSRMKLEKAAMGQNPRLAVAGGGKPNLIGITQMPYLQDETTGTAPMMMMEGSTAALSSSFSSRPQLPRRMSSSPSSHSAAPMGHVKHAGNFLDNLRKSSEKAYQHHHHKQKQQDGDGDDGVLLFPGSFDDSIIFHGPRQSQIDSDVIGQQSEEEEEDEEEEEEEEVSSKVDESLIMTLSDSEHGGTTTTAAGAVAEVDHHLVDRWEAQNSADDEKTAERPARIRLQSNKGKGQHRRSKSGDYAAASLLTGGTDWKGMEQDKIPLPRTIEDDDDDDDDEEAVVEADHERNSRRIHMRESRGEKGRRGEMANAKVEQERDRKLDTARDFGSKGLGHQHPKSLLQQSLSSHAPQPPPSHAPRSDASGAEVTIQNNSSFMKGSRSYSIDSSARDSYMQESLASLPEESGESTYDTDNDDDEDDEEDDNWPRSVQNNRLHMTEGVTLDELEHQYEDRGFRGSHQNVVRHHVAETDSDPFSNLIKGSPGKAPRSAFLPMSSNLDDDDEYPTYICPRCRTRQREFFSVSDAPLQQQGPSAYLAMYFFIYVVASLFIFGLEEGWMPLDCIYFAVITLTTAGLGDFVPTSDVNKLICSIFIYFGVACIGLLLGSYIAGMLDDRAHKDRKAKQMTSCPNCARIEMVASKQREMPGMGSESVGPASSQLRRYMSERIAPVEVPRSAVIVSSHKHDHGRHNHSHHSSDGSGMPNAHHDHSRHSSDGSGLPHVRSVGSQNSSYQARTPTTVASKHLDNTVSTEAPPANVRIPAQYSPTGNILGSPMTRQILGRQQHTRHASIDISHRDLFVGNSTSQRGRDNLSMNPPSSVQATTINEGTPLNARPFSMALSQQRDSMEFYGTSGSADSDFSDDVSTDSSVSESSYEELLDETTFKIKGAKYVFLTLRQALVNSMVIIAVGCFGFCLIEGFTVIDSWYFTTVLLTTVGYGDIVPVTKGGKLFATIYILVAGTILLNNMSLISMIPLELRRRRIERAVLMQFGDQLDDAALRELATGPVIQRLHLSANRPDGLDECTREMFSLAMLVRLGKVTEDDIRETFAAFRRLDVFDEGVLNSKSIIAGMIQKRRMALGRIPPPPAPPVYVQEPEDAAHLDQEMRAFWFGRSGSLHVNTESSSYHFMDPNHAPVDGSSDAFIFRSLPAVRERDETSRYVGRGQRRVSQESPF